MTERGCHALSLGLLQLMLDAEIPVLGFTGTHLSPTQKEEWLSRGFDEVAPTIPDTWMPKTRIAFVGVPDSFVVAEDARIRNELGKAFAAFGSSLISWSEIKRRAEAGDVDALAILRLSAERLRLFESPGGDGSKYTALVGAAAGAGPSVMTRYIDVAHQVAQSLRGVGVSADEVDGSHDRQSIKRKTSWFRAQPKGSSCSLVMTRDLGGRGLDFPNAASVVFVSPRSNYQTVAQEVARIRSRSNNLKQATFFYYAGTEEQAKARRLAQHLAADKFGTARLFVIDGTMPDDFALEPFESVNLRNEEALA